MLTIQTASAGSGKTYTLAKNFIINLIAFKNNKQKWTLRNKKQIEDALLHIMAITFTNKATNEMKERIIHNLSCLSKAVELKNLDEEFIKNTKYLKEFKTLLNVEYQEIGAAAETALKAILNNYSLFRISTIDSFFQEILRTFTYEANLNEAYQLEIDSSFVTDSAIDASIQELDSHPSKMGNAFFWMKTIMQQEAKKSQLWNPFNKKDVKRSVYSNIRNALFKLENEDFKEIKDKLDDYFKTPEDSANLIKAYKDFQRLAIEERNQLLSHIQRKAKELNDLISLNNIEDQINKVTQFKAHLAIGLNLKFDTIIKNEFNEYIKNNSILKKDFRDKGNPVDITAMEFYSLMKEWKNPSANSLYKNWLVYGELMPYFGLLLEVRIFLSEILENNNLIQLSDTSFMLKKIIGEEDTPFIYERLGNRIDHFLIDEFQDTSRMQWEVIQPLISESEAKGQDSLIIGDPKQSIYRFRNANHKLITEDVPNLFSNHIAAGISIEENTNWRSHTRIVKFNNYFFKILSNILKDYSAKSGNTYDYNKLYSNVVQYPHKQEGKGYIEIQAFEKPAEILDDESEELEDEENKTRKNWFEEKVLPNIGKLINSLLERGYSQSDIAILVNTNENGQKIVKSLIDYNMNLSDDAERINFISEESLLVSSSKAVSIIIGVLEKLSKPGFNRKMQQNTEKTEHEENLKTKSINWNKIKLSYTLYSNRYSEMDPIKRITSFLNEADDDSLEYLLETLSAPSLSSLVETIIHLFLDEKLKRAEGIYLSSLQDLINEYSSNHPNDPASFLEWWNSRGKRMSVSVPEGSNAVQIMTVHKSKGLEFKCVILPFATDSFVPSQTKSEWRWVDDVNVTGINLPKVLPIRTSNTLMGSKYETIYREFIDQTLTDKINMFYVAFTRAKNELYVFTKYPDKKYPNLSSYIKQILFEKKEFADIFKEEEMESVISLEDVEILEEEKIIKIGTPLTEEEILQENYKGNKEDSTEILFFDDYYVNKKRPHLRSVAGRVTPSGEFGSVPAIN